MKMKDRAREAAGRIETYVAALVGFVASLAAMLGVDTTGLCG